MRITTRLSLMSGCTTAALVGLILVLAWSFRGFTQAKNNNALAVRLTLNLFERTSYRDQYFLHREERARASYFQLKDGTDQLLAQARRQFTSLPQRQFIEQFQLTSEETAALFQRIVANTQAMARPGSSQAIFQELDRRLASQAFLKAASLRDLALTLQEASEAQVEQANQRLTVIIGLFALTLAAVTILTSVQIRALIHQGLAPLHSGVRRIADGHLEVRLTSRGQDEFSELAQAINTMAEKLQSFTRQLESDISQRKLAEILEGVDAHIYLKDLQGRYLFGNRPVREALGVSLEQLVGRTDAAFQSGPSLVRLCEQDRRVLEGGETVRQEETLTDPRTGHRASYWSVKHPVRDEAGAIYALCGVSTDISERKALEAQLQQARKLESLGTLASGVAHDMNNVLAAILGLASAHLPRQAPDSPDYQAFDTIARAASRGGMMVKRLLGFARQTPAENLPLDLNRLVREEVAFLQTTTLAGVDIDQDLAPELHPIRGDSSALAHVFMNLCGNAVDAMSGQGRLLLRTRNLGPDQVEVLVQDSGTGMAREVLDKALDPFFTTKEQGKGTGLGLTLVHSTMTAHGGRLELQSEPGQGTRVRLLFPASTEPAPATPAASAPGPAPAQPALTVLLVDDDELVQRSTGALLGLLGHRVRLADTGEAALTQLETDSRPDLVILDLNMPGLGGIGTLPRLSALHPGLPVLLATGRTDQTALDLVARYEQVSLLAKPYTLEELQRAMAALGVT